MKKLNIFHSLAAALVCIVLAIILYVLRFNTAVFVTALILTVLGIFFGLITLYLKDKAIRGHSTSTQRGSAPDIWDRNENKEKPTNPDRL
mgnify:FL=1